MKKRLCLFMMSLLLLMSTGCSQITPQTLETLVTESSESASGSITAIGSNSEDNLNTDTGSATTESTDNTSNTAKEDSFTDSPDASSDNSSSANAGEESFTDNSATGISESDSSIDESNSSSLPEGGSYTSKEDVALYIHLYGHLPPNFITKKEAEELGWKGGSLEPYAPGKCIGGSRFGNYEELLPIKEGRSYTECDIDTLGADKRGAKRIVFSNDGLIYYTEDHYKSFELLYGEADP